MKRRAAILVLALMLVPILCGVHHCGGESCPLCARIIEARRDFSCPLYCAALLFAALTLYASHHLWNTLRRIVSRTLIELKVCLID